MRKLPQVLVLSTIAALTSWNARAEMLYPGTPPGNGIPVSSELGGVTLSWHPPIQNEDGSALTDLAGYFIYYGRSPDALNLRIALDNPGLTRHFVDGLPAVDWYFALTAVNRSGRESALSAIVRKRIT